MTESNITNNTAGDEGGAIYNGDGTVEAHFNRIVDNSQKEVVSGSDSHH